MSVMRCFCGMKFQQGPELIAQDAELNFIGTYLSRWKGVWHSICLL